MKVFTALWSQIKNKDTKGVHKYDTSCMSFMARPIPFGMAILSVNSFCSPPEWPKKLSHLNSGGEQKAKEVYKGLDLHGHMHTRHAPASSFDPPSWINWNRS